jgi:DHA3 family macrolide efflux protein-like MFS transporter
LQVVRSFGDEVWRLTAIEVTFSIGMMLGGFLIASWGGFKNRFHSMLLAGFTIGLCTIGLGAIPVFWLYLFIMVITGLAIPVFSTPATVLLQERVEGDYMGRVFGVYGMISSAMMPIGMLVFGPVSDFIDIEWLLIGTGVLMLVQNALMLGSKALLQAGKPRQGEETPSS